MKSSSRNEQKPKKLTNHKEVLQLSIVVLPVGLTAKIDYISKFLRRVKQLSKDPSGIMNDSKGINLSRYISEVA